VIAVLFSTTRGRIGLTAAVVVLLAAVGWYVVRDGQSPGPSAVPPATTSAPAADGPVSMDGRAPLTGLPTTAALDHPAVTVKVSNTPDAHPQRGLGAADIVFVEPITRAVRLHHRGWQAVAARARLDLGRVRAARYGGPG
jgi:hypothetical protein